MCGITGIIYKDKSRKVDATQLQKANDTLTHRGPDDSGFFIDNHVGLAMRRLSIIDVSHGHQPITNEDSTKTIVFNGEIYNHLEIRDRLSQKDHHFKTQTDTESILHNYEEKGIDCLHDLNGMFAFSIWDSQKQLLHIARDRMGIKPLFYYEDQEKFIFASEIKALLAYENIDARIENQSVFQYFTYNYIPAPNTIYKKIKKLQPGHYLKIRTDSTKIVKYWDINYKINPIWTLSKATEKLEELLYDAVKIRLMSEVPLGAFLSGGIDSSTLCNIMKNHNLKNELNTFSIGFDIDSKYNELPFSSLMANKLGTIHHTKTLRPNMIELLPRVQSSLDEPMSDPSNIPTYLLSQFTKEKVTVALSGDGGDELFAGYERQSVMNILQRAGFLPDFIKKTMFSKINAQEQQDGLIPSLKRILFDISQGNSATYKRWISNFNNDIFCSLLDCDLKGQYKEFQLYDIVEKAFKYATHPINQSLAFETKYYLPDDLLVKVDRMSMAHSLEVRVPFLDHRIVKFAASLPIDMKIRHGKTKYILKHLMKKYLPKEIINKPKQGFSPPIKKWLKSDLKNLVYQSLLESNYIQNYFKKNSLETLLNDHYSGHRDYQYQIWSLLVFTIWLENHNLCN